MKPSELLNDDRVFSSSQRWKQHARCAAEEKLFTEDTQICSSIPVPTELEHAVGQAKRHCISCVVRQTCLDAAMVEESYLGGTERHGVRGAFTARERVLVAAEDPLCSRCQENPVAKWQRICHIKRLCRKCQQELKENPEQKYFPEFA